MRAGTSPPQPSEARFKGISITFKAKKASLHHFIELFVLELRSLRISLSAANLDTISILFM